MWLALFAIVVVLLVEMHKLEAGSFSENLIEWDLPWLN